MLTASVPTSHTKQKSYVQVTLVLLSMLQGTKSLANNLTEYIDISLVIILLFPISWGGIQESVSLDNSGCSGN